MSNKKKTKHPTLVGEITKMERKGWRDLKKLKKKK